MSDPYIGEIRLFAGNFAPLGWLFCDGTLLPISQYDALFNLIGTTYGGDGRTTFALPDLRGRVPVHQANGYVIGQTGGTETVTLTTTQVPAHTHQVDGTSATASANSPAGNVPATLAEVTTLGYGTDAPPTTLAPPSISGAGGSQPHDNLQPFQCLEFIIALEGIYPSPN